jgi:hypothetical protein
VELANILGGHDATTNGLTKAAARSPARSAARRGILSVEVGGDWVRSNLTAGATPGADNPFGEVDDAETGGKGTEDLIVWIAAIAIQGQVVGTPFAVRATDPYGFAVENIGAFSVAKTAFALTAKESNDSLFVGSTGDAMLAEVTSGGPAAGGVCWSGHLPLGARRHVSLFASACQGRFVAPSPPVIP